MKLDPHDSGEVIVRIWQDAPINEEVRKAAMEEARKAVDDNLKEDGPLAMKHLNTVVTKLSVCVGIIDAASDVRSALNYITSFIDVPFRYTPMSS